VDKKILALCDSPNISLGLRFAGMECKIVNSATELVHTLDNINKEEFGVIVIFVAPSLLDKCAEKLEHFRAENLLPLVIDI